jgi:hypothetical protein
MENIVIATFDDANAALQGLREFQQLDDSGKLGLRDAAVVERRPDSPCRITTRFGAAFARLTVH